MKPNANVTRGLAPLITALMLACGGDTGGKQVASPPRCARHEIDAPFATKSGCTCGSRARSLGGRANSSTVPRIARAAEGVGARLELLSPSAGAAHPGHYVAGTRSAETVTGLVELLGGVSALAGGTGVTGVYRSARFVFAPPRGEPERAQLGGDYVARVDGTASRDAQTVHFRLAVALAEVARSAASGRVDGCVFEEHEIDGDGTVRVTVSPRVWLTLADFTGVAPGTPTAPTDIAAGAQPRTAFALGLAQLSAYHFTFAPQAPKETL